MDINTVLPLLLALAWLLPLASFGLIVLFGPRMGRSGYYAAFVATVAIVTSFALSAAAMVFWIWHHPLGGGHGGHAPAAICGDWYALGVFGALRVTIGYYIDALTLAMFCMVSLISSCIHVYSFGYMHGELSKVTDAMAPLADGRPCERRGRFHRFFQYLSLFSFSMLGLSLAGNVAMVFVFWELVGICSYLLIGFWHERKSASNAANKAFIVNRIGDFGMIVGLMALWLGLGTFSFGDYQIPDAQGHTTTMPGIFSQVRPPSNDHKLRAPGGLIPPEELHKLSHEIAPIQEELNRSYQERAEEEARSLQERFSAGENPVRITLSAPPRISFYYAGRGGYAMLILAGLGIFCGCVGKSAQFPLHVWLPDAMEGPTPVSALIHAATMVAAGVYLVGRFYPVFTPEVLLVIACVGCITLFLAASIALVATDIKRVLAYSTVSQLGFMMLALGLGGWLAGMFHLFTHAFFKSLLFLGSGSVIHACGTNEMPQMGGLRKKMPITAATMLVGCLAISGAGLPAIFGLGGIGFSGFHSKDYIMAQGLWFWFANPRFGGLFYYTALIGAGMTAFYMFRLWYMTFAGNPRDGYVHHHAHESPKVMTAPLVVLAVMATTVAWNVPWTSLGLEPLLNQAQPAGTAEGIAGGQLWPGVQMPAEHEAHERPEVGGRSEWAAFAAALIGFLLATVFYGLRKLDPKDVSQTLAPLHWILVRKWLFDELYAVVFVRPVLRVSDWVAAVDRRCIDWLADRLAGAVEAVARLDNWIDRWFVDRPIDLVAGWTYALGLRLRILQTGNVRQYVLWLTAGAVGLFVLMSLYWSYAVAGM